MLAAIQGAVLDFLQRASISDSDGFAREAAIRYLRSRASKDDPITALGKIRTSTFSARRRERAELTAALVKHLDRRFRTRIARVEVDLTHFPVANRRPAAPRTANPATRLTAELARFKHSTEARNVDTFWVKRTKGVLKQKPEQEGQALLISFLSGVLRSPRHGTILKEVQSGIGYVDVMVFLGTSEPQIVELKVIPKGNARGVSQLRQYLQTEQANLGWLIIFDARKQGPPIAEGPTIESGITVHTIVIDINPPPPSSLG